jgi:hypothetical protein
MATRAAGQARCQREAGWHRAVHACVPADLAGRHRMNNPWSVPVDGRRAAASSSSDSTYEMIWCTQ